MSETYALHTYGEIGVLGVHNYERMFCPWNISNFSFGLDIRLHPKTEPTWVSINNAILSWFVYYMRYG